MNAALYVKGRTMRLGISVVALIAAWCLTPQQKGKIDNYETSGNLQSTAAVGCVSLAELTNMHTPADIYPGVLACITSGKYEKAVPLFALAGAYGRFDQLRVTDPTARQAVKVLQLNNFGSLSSERQEGFKKAFLAATKGESASLKKLCSEVERIGPPKYFPTYMVQHGMRAFEGQSGNGVKADFNPAEGWREALTGYLHCP
jgi:hypothetical protein